MELSSWSLYLRELKHVLSHGHGTPESQRFALASFLVAVGDMELNLALESGLECQDVLVSALLVPETGDGTNMNPLWKHIDCSGHILAGQFARAICAVAAASKPEKRGEIIEMLIQRNDDPQFHHAEREILVLGLKPLAESDPNVRHFLGDVLNRL